MANKKKNPFGGLATNIEEAIQEFYAKTPEEQRKMYEEQGLTPEQIVEQEAYVEAHRPPTDIVGPGPPTTEPPTLTPTESPTLEPIPGVTPAPEIEAPVVPPMPGVTPAPEIPAVEVTPAPAYEISPEQQEIQDMLGDKLTDWVQAGGYGLPPEVQAQMIQQQTDFLKARETESVRVMRNNMERRGITNSGFLISAESQIHSNTSVAIAGAIADVQINSALMKMASFEKAMGATAQFLGYLSEQSQLAYAPGFATWGAQTAADMTKYTAEISTSLEQWRMENQFAITNWQAQTQALFSQWEVNANNIIAQWKMENQFNLTEWQSRAEYDLALFSIESQLNLAQWQAQMDLYKLELNNAYQTQDTILQGQIQTELANLQHQHNLELAEMEIESNQKTALYQGVGGLFGTVLTLIFGK